MASSADELEREALRLLDEAFAHPPERREAFVYQETEGKPAVRARVMALLAAEAEDALPIATGGALAAEAGELPPPERVGPWRLTGLIGRGGMGTVYAGERDDGAFEQTVAIKFVRWRREDGRLAERLREERRLLARLSHPHIAQIFDGGETADGTPYLVMEYVPGNTLADMAKEAGFTAERRFDVIAALFSAIGYAHQRLVVHGDLSPANVLIREDGIAKVIDFGIARSLDEASPRSGSRTATKGFTAPERLAGEPATTLSDVFALGAILRFLSKGLALSRLRDLDAMIARATAAEPDKRYASVEAFAADFVRYREGRALAARGGGGLYRTRRLVGRHPLSTSAAIVGLLSLAGALIVTSNLLVRAKDAEAEAIARFDALRGLSETVLFDVYDALDGIPRTNEAQRLVTQIGQEYLEALEGDPRASDSLSLSLAKGYVQLGHIAADPNKDFFADPGQAEHFWAAAADRLDALERAGAKSALLFSVQGDLRRWQAQNALIGESDVQKADALFGEAAEYFEHALKLDSDHQDAAIGRIGALSSRAEVAQRLAEPERAERYVTAAIDAGEALMAEGAAPGQTALALSNARRVFGRILTESGAFERAVSVLSASLEDLDAAETANGEDAFTLRARAIALWRRGFAKNRGGDQEAAVADYQAAISLTHRRLAIDPDDADAARYLVVLSGEVALPLSALGRYAEAAEALRETRLWHEARYERAPDDGRMQRALLVQSAQETELYRAWGREDERCAAIAALVLMADIMIEAGTLSPEDAAALAPYREEGKACGI